MELKIGNFRLTNIVKFNGIEKNKIKSRTLEDKDGLAIEMTIDGGKSYFVISYVKPEKTAGQVIENVGTRFLQYVDENNFHTYKTMCEIGCTIIRELNVVEIF